MERFARQIAGQGYIVAAPSSYHEFTGPEALAYDVPGTDAGNEYKIQKVCYWLSSWIKTAFYQALPADLNRPLRVMTKTLRFRSITFFLLRRAMAVSEQLECVLVAI